MDRNHHIYLIPGFLGFANLGELSYFGHTQQVLGARFAAMKLDAEIRVVCPPPTASLPIRAAKVAEAIAAMEEERTSGPIHLIGHSSGGLDARLLTAPGVGLPTTIDWEPLVARVQTVITVSTPHHGTPLASFFATLQGQKLLQLLSVNTIYALSFGRLPLAALLWMGSLAVRYGDIIANSELLDELFGRLLDDFTAERRREVRALLSDIVSDQALMLQLTPEAMEVFNAAVLPRPGVRYGTVVTRSPQPSFRSTLSVGIDPAAQVTHAVYAGLHRIIASTTPRDLPELTSQQAQALRGAYGRTSSTGANDGVVPTRSQTWGEVIHATRADHLDVIGHFRDASQDPPHLDWLVSGSGFARDRFERLWADVARFVSAGAQAQPGRRSAARSRAGNRATS